MHILVATDDVVSDSAVDKIAVMRPNTVRVEGTLDDGPSSGRTSTKCLSVRAE